MNWLEGRWFAEDCCCISEILDRLLMDGGLLFLFFHTCALNLGTEMMLCFKCCNFKKRNKVGSFFLLL